MRIYKELDDAIYIYGTGGPPLIVRDRGDGRLRSVLTGDPINPAIVDAMRDGRIETDADLFLLEELGL